jgi:hypothetical protein
VHAADGRQWHAPYVLMTLPLGVLKVLLVLSRDPERELSERECSTVNANARLAIGLLTLARAYLHAGPVGEEQGGIRAGALRGQAAGHRAPRHGHRASLALPDPGSLPGAGIDRFTAGFSDGGPPRTQDSGSGCFAQARRTRWYCVSPSRSGPTATRRAATGARGTWLRVLPPSLAHMSSTGARPLGRMLTSPPPLRRAGPT